MRRRVLEGEKCRDKISRKRLSGERPYRSRVTLTQPNVAVESELKGIPSVSTITLSLVIPLRILLQRTLSIRTD